MAWREHDVHAESFRFRVYAVEIARSKRIRREQRRRDDASANTGTPISQEGSTFHAEKIPT